MRSPPYITSVLEHSRIYLHSSYTSSANFMLPIFIYNYLREKGCSRHQHTSMLQILHNTHFKFNYPFREVLLLAFEMDLFIMVLPVHIFRMHSEIIVRCYIFSVSYIGNFDKGFQNQIYQLSKIGNLFCVNNNGVYIVLFWLNYRCSVRSYQSLIVILWNVLCNVASVASQLPLPP